MMKKYHVGVLLLFFAAQAHAETSIGDTASQTGDAGSSQEITSTAETQSTGAEASSYNDGDEDSNTSDTDEGYVFGYRNGYLHGALAAKGEWTDNLYNTDADKQSNFLTQISPSVWLTLPRRSKKPMQLVSDNTAIGGLQYSPPDTDIYTKMQAYLSGTLDYMAYSEDSDLNHTEGNLEGMFQYRPAEKLTFQVLEQYNHSQDIYNRAEATQENDRIYDSNVFGLGAAWYSKDKFSVKAAYRNFFLEYDDDINDYMNRTDNGFDAALYYEYSEKTNFFLQYQYLVAAYDTEKMPDNDNNIFVAGINWQATVKTNLMAKAGYQLVDYDELNPYSPYYYSTYDDSDSKFYFETQGVWHATVKSNVLLNAKYSIEQSDSEMALNKSVFAFRVAFGHRFTDRLRADANLVYEDSEYAQFDGSTRNDDRWYFKPQVQFAVNKWLFLNAYVSYDTKDSDYEGLDYDTSTFGVGIRGSF
jgi:hypothetical protein